MGDPLGMRIRLLLWPVRRSGVFLWSRRACVVLALMLLGRLMLAQLGVATDLSVRSLSLPGWHSLAGLAVDPILDRVYVAGDDGVVWILDGASGDLLGQADTGAGSGGDGQFLPGTAPYLSPAARTGVDTARHRVYVVDWTGGLAVLDGVTGAVAVPWPFAAATGLVVDATADRVLVARPGQRALTVLDADRYQAVATVAADWVPGAVAVDGATRRVYVADVATSRLAVLDGDTYAIRGAVNLGHALGAVAVHPRTRRVYVADPIGGNVTVIDGAAGAVIAIIPVGRAPSGLAINSVTDHLVVANADDDTVTIVDTRRDQVVATERVGRYPVAVVVNERTGRVYVANSHDQTLSVLRDARPPLPILTAVEGWWR